MSGQQPASVHLRRLVPLIAVLGLLGPGAALAGSPAPDQPPGAAAPAPDPAPVKHVATREPAAVTPLTVEPPRPTINDRVATPAASPVKHAARARPRPVTHARPTHVIPTHVIPVVDVTPSFVDLHPGLGALPRDESRLVLAAAALLVAAAAAGTGTILTLTARVRR